MTELFVTAAPFHSNGPVQRPMMRPITWILSGLLACCPLVCLASHPALGSPAPQFRLQDQAGKWHELKNYRGKWVALYFYPKDQTPGCSTQACEFRDNVFAFREAGAVILGISVDDVKSHRKFAAKYSLPFPILADPGKDAVRKYGVLKNFIGGLQLARRDTFLLDPQGRIVKHYTEADPKGHSNLVLADIKELQQDKER